MDPDGVYEKRCSNLSQAISTQDEGFGDPEDFVECKKVVVEADKPGTVSSVSAESNEDDYGCAGVSSAPPLLPPKENAGDEEIAVPRTLDNMSAIPPPTPGSVVIPLTTTTTTDAKPFGLYSANADLPVASAVPVINDASAVSNNDTASTTCMSGAERVRLGSARVLPVPNDSINRPTDHQHNDLESNDISQEHHEKIQENACVISKTKIFLALIIAIVVVAAVGVALAMVLGKNINDEEDNLSHAKHSQAQTQSTVAPKQSETEPTIPPKQPQPGPTAPPKQPKPDPDPTPTDVDTCHLPIRTGPFSLSDCK